VTPGGEFETYEEYGESIGIDFFDYQTEALFGADQLKQEHLRSCLYFRTGAGKSYTALALLGIRNYNYTVVIAPPSTHPAWIAAGRKFGISVEPMSHAKFRGKRTKLQRDVPVIADEFHLFGGQRGMGWKKLDRLAGGLQAPLILASATPNYNDAERVYCIQHILDPLSCRGGFLEFLYTHCNTEQNPFGSMPLVSDEQPFKLFKDAAEFLSSLPGVFYLPDTLTYDIGEVQFPAPALNDLEGYGYNRREHKMVASDIEMRHTRVFQQYVNEGGELRSSALANLKVLLPDNKSAMVFCNHATIAEAAAKSLIREGYDARLITGKTPAKEKNWRLEDFRQKKFKILVGTASLATGTDGLDKVCDTMIILDDTDDPSLRRQLIGRIMPRGAASDASKKRVHRLLPLA
jgi:hypothetical protein